MMGKVRKIIIGFKEVHVFYKISKQGSSPTTWDGECVI